VALYSPLGYDAEPEFDPESAMSHSNTRKLMRYLVVALLALLGLFLLWKSPVGTWAKRLFDPLPQAEDVQVMTASLGNSPKRRPDLPPFTVPANHVPKVLAALQPAQKDPQPAKWQVLGYLQITTDGGITVINLYWTNGDKGAFSIEGISHRTYFRGGTDQAIEDAIREAYADSIREPK
jgi:hypothetical protein